MIRCLLTAVLLSTTAGAQTPPTLEGLIDADQRLAAGDLALDWVKRTPLDRPKTATRQTAAALDLAAQQAIQEGHLTRAQTYLEAAALLTGPTESLRHRMGDLFLKRAQNAPAEVALSALRGAFLLAKRPADRARLADHLAALAVAEYAAEHGEAGDALLNEARSISPRRPQVMRAFSLRPKASPKARAGLLIIVVGVAFFALRRLKRVLLSPTPPARRVRSHSRLRSRWRV